MRSSQQQNPPVELNRFGRMYLNHLMDNRRQMFEEMKADGSLHQHLKERSDRAANQYESLLRHGAQSLEAEEMVTRELLTS